VEWGAFPINILYPQNKHMPRRLRVFIDHLAGITTQTDAKCDETMKAKVATTK
jgi:DNA-binding transcriptional LysR family regulator